MMGKDCERLTKEIDTMKNVLYEQLETLIDITLSQTDLPVLPNIKIVLTDRIKSTLESMSDDISKMKGLNDGLYTSKEEFNNSCGSPWTELNEMERDVKKIETYANAHITVTAEKEKRELAQKINIAIMRCIDAKYALISYHDYIQRGYDVQYNEKKPSITFDVGVGKKSIGNMDQVFEENVHIPTPSIDPF